MLIHIEKSSSHRFLYFSLLSIGFVVLAANFFGKETAYIVSNVLFIPIPAILVILSITVVMMYKGKGQHGKAWLLFFGLAVSWFIAEQIWFVYDVVYHIDPWPSIADFFYLAGYPFLFLFSIYYLKPVEKAITKKMLVSASLLSMGLLIPTIYLTITSNQEEDLFKLILAASYPMADAIVMFPGFIGLTLFFRGEVNFFWALMCLAVVLNVIADTSFLFLNSSDSYYTGHPIDILYLWGYVIFSAGVYNHAKIFKTTNKYKYDNLEELR